MVRYHQRFSGIISTKSIVLAELWPLNKKSSIITMFSIVSCVMLTFSTLQKTLIHPTFQITYPANCPITPQYNCLNGYLQATHVITFSICFTLLLSRLYACTCKWIVPDNDLWLIKSIKCIEIGKKLSLIALVNKYEINIVVMFALESGVID